LASGEKKRATAGFIVSLIGGIIILITDISLYYGLGEIGFISAFTMMGVGDILTVLFALGLLWAILVIVGAALMFTGRTTAGGVLAILFSIFSLFSLAFGGFIIGLILGLIGGALGIAKK